MRIALISVAPPFRGGISKHTSILVDELSQKHYVKVINYKRQYPNFLFPGKTQYIDNQINKTMGERCLDSINPLTWFKTARKLSITNYDLIIFRFWSPFFSFSLGLIAFYLRKKTPTTKLISLIDNIIPHEKIPFGTFLARYMLKKMHGHLVQSSQTVDELLSILQNPIYEKRFHPIYNTFPKKIDKNNALNKLGINSKLVILHFGLIRPYKGLDVLLKAGSYLKKKTNDFHIIIAGECYSNKEKYINLIEELDISDLITWHDQYIPDKEVSTYFSAADITVLPYKTASQSGIINISYNYDLPVIVTCVGGLHEVVQEGKSGFIIERDNPTALADILFNQIEKTTLDKMSKFIQYNKHIYSWEKFVNGIEILYNRL